MNNSIKQPFTFDRVVRLVIGVGVAVVLFFLLNKLSGVLLPFLVAWLLAYIIYPIVCFFQYRCRLKIRILAILVTLILLTGFITLLFWIAIPPLVSEVGRTATLIQQTVSEMETSSLLPENLQVLLLEWYNDFDIQSLLTADVFKEAKTYLPQMWGFLTDSLSFVISLFVVFVVLLYLVFILLDYEVIANGWLGFIPQKYRLTVMQIFDDVKSGMNRYFRGQALIALIITVILAVGFEIINLPLGLLLAVLMGILSLVPYLKMVMLPALAFFALLQSMETGTSFWVIILSVFVVLAFAQLFEDFFLVPKIMGKAMSMNPAVILLSLSVWGVLLGVAGMIIALPVTTILISYYRRIIIDGGTIVQEEMPLPLEEV